MITRPTPHAGMPAADAAATAASSTDVSALGAQRSALDPPPWQTPLHPGAPGATGGGGTLPGTPLPPLAAAGPAAEVSAIGYRLSAIEPSLAEALRNLEARGGWDARLPPPQAWAKAVGDLLPYPADPQAFAALPTLGPLDRLLRDDQLTDIHCNGPARVVCIRQAGSSMEWQTDLQLHPDWYPWLLQQCVGRGQGRATVSQWGGTLDVTPPGRPPCRVRYEILAPPLCPAGPSLTLRVLRPQHFALPALVAGGMLSGAMATVLTLAVEAGVSILVVGPTGSGKTTLLRALLNLELAAQGRVISIEDVPELLLPQPTALALLAQPGLATMLQLTYTAARLNPAAIALGEVRGAEAYALLAAMRAGHPVLTTIHGETAMSGLDNFVAMALEAPESQGSADLVRLNLNNRPLLIVALARLRSGQRRVLELSELLPTGSVQHPLPQPRWRYDAATDGWQRVSPVSLALDQLFHQHGQGATLAHYLADEGVE